MINGCIRFDCIQRNGQNVQHFKISIFYLGEIAQVRKRQGGIHKLYECEYHEFQQKGGHSTSILSKLICWLRDKNLANTSKFEAIIDMAE